MYTRDIQSLVRVKHVIDHLKAIDTTTLTETERNAVRDCLQQAYERAAFFLIRNRYAEFINTRNIPTRRLPSPPCTRVIEPKGRNELGTALMNVSAPRSFRSGESITRYKVVRHPLGRANPNIVVWFALPHRIKGCLMNAQR
jgi:hypothetical protein